MNRIQVLERTIAENAQIVEEVSAKLPQLEQQKAEAVAGKNYKMAGQVTTQIKQLQSRKESASTAGAAAQEELGAVRADSAEELAALEVSVRRARESR